MNPFNELKDKCSEIEQKLNYSFFDKNLLMLSFVHRSFYNENKKIIDSHNERLEFLGDAVLNLIVSEYLFKKFDTATEGKLSFFRSQIVDSTSCTSYVKKLNLQEYVLLGKGEKQTEERGRESILADLFEAIIGALYLDGGFLKAQEFFMFCFEEDVRNFLEQPSSNYKAELQHYCQKKYMKPPLYQVIKENGPDHEKIFEIVASIDEIELGKGEGGSKKIAEQAAAKNALEKL